jgi:serine/threonine protein kinase
MASDNPSVGRLQLSRASGSIGVGRYRVFASLGRGGMAEIQLASAQGPKGFNKLVVVKRLRPLLADDAAAVNMFLDEARLDARLNHPNLIHTYEFGEERGAYFIVMEFLEGQPLNEILYAIQGPAGKPGRVVSPSVWAKIVSDALAGLHYAHELRDYDGTPLGVVHRDVSPQNIIVTYDGGVKLVDFGIAKASVNAAKTESQVIKGKLAYMAPEQVDGATLDRRADIFAMGIVLWECLTQKRLATGDARAVLAKIVDMEFQAPSLLNPAVPAELDAIVRRALEHAPADRYPTAQAMREALERFRRGQPDIVDETTVGSLVSGLFSFEREQIQRQVRIQMAEGGQARDLTVADSTPSQRIAMSSDAAPRAQLPELGPSSPMTESVASLRAVRTSVTSEARTATGKRRALMVALAMLALVAVTFTLRRPAGGVTDTPRLVAAAAPSPARDRLPPAATEGVIASPAPSENQPSMASPVDAGSAAPSVTPAPSSRPPPPSRSPHGSRVPAPPRAPSGPPKLDPDPWR